MVQQFLSYGLPPAPATAGPASPAGTAAVSTHRAPGPPGAVNAVLTDWLEVGSLALSAPSGALATTPASEVAPSSSSFYDGQYVPPGLQPGHVPPRCPT